MIFSSWQTKKVTGIEQSMQLISERLEVFHARPGLVDVIDAPFSDQGSFLPGCIHCQIGSLSHQPGMMVREPSRVCVFARGNKSHLIVIDQVVK